MTFSTLIMVFVPYDCVAGKLCSKENVNRSAGGNAFEKKSPCDPQRHSGGGAQAERPEALTYPARAASREGAHPVGAAMGAQHPAAPEGGANDTERASHSGAGVRQAPRRGGNSREKTEMPSNGQQERQARPPKVRSRTGRARQAGSVIDPTDENAG